MGGSSEGRRREGKRRERRRESLTMGLYQLTGRAMLCTCRFYSEDAAGRNGGYRAAPYCIELRGTENDGYGFVLPANQVGNRLVWWLFPTYA